MLIYQSKPSTNSSITHKSGKKKTASKRKGYKSTNKRKRGVIHAKVAGRVGRKKSKSKSKSQKKLLKRNRQFLEQLGLKVKEKE